MNKRPEKIEGTSISEYQRGGIASYNQALKEMDEWLPDENELESIIRNTEWDMMSGGGTRDVARAIHQRIMGGE